MRISDWSSDVCSSDLRRWGGGLHRQWLVAWRLAFRVAECDLDADRSGGLMADQEKRLVDLSPVIEPGMTTYNGLPVPILCDYWTRAASAALYDAGSTFQIGRIVMVAHIGTFLPRSADLTFALQYLMPISYPVFL